VTVQARGMSRAAAQAKESWRSIPIYLNKREGISIDLFFQQDC
jgi:hypothetical protein